MRGIGRGQTITVFIIPEVEELMARELSDKKLGKPEQRYEQQPKRRRMKRPSAILLAG